ncbi:MAG: ATP-binding protein [bacterium]|nr:ATP-binding protein [bacterium]
MNGGELRLARGPLWWYSRRFPVPIRVKLLVPMLGLILVFGVVHVLVINRLVFHSLEREYIRNSVVAARVLSARLEEALLYGDRNEVITQLWEWKQLDAEHAYAFIVDSRERVTASTFPRELPRGLAALQSPGNGKPAVRRILDRREPLIDVAIPLVQGGAGWLRLGFREDPVVLPARRVAWLALSMVGVFVLLGLAGAWVFSHLFTAPIGQLLERTAAVNLDGPPVRLDLRTGDEWQELATAFEGMTDRLQDSHRELAQAIRRASEAERMASLGLMAAGVAHEISNPVAGVELGLKRIEKRPEDVAQMAKYLPRMLNSIAHVQEIVREMLAFARPDQPALGLVDPRELINQTLILLAHRLEEGRVTLTQEHEGGDLRLMADPQQLRQVLVNLLGNALDAMPEGGSLLLGTRRRGSELEIRIRDSGSGMSPAVLERMWEPFFTTKPVGRGTGLGLAVTRTLVARHQGRIEVESRVGLGTTFTLSFPLEGPREPLAAD